MKKILSLLIAISVMLSVLFCSAIEASAFFGTGAQVVASDVKMIKTGLVGQKITFTDGDFKSALVLSNFDTRTITESPSATEQERALWG